MDDAVRLLDVGNRDIGDIALTVLDHQNAILGHDGELTPANRGDLVFTAVGLDLLAELRTVRRSILVTPPGEGERAPYPRERVLDGEGIKVAAGGLAWIRRDGGATLLVRGPAQLTVREGVIDLVEGRVFVDTPAGVVAELTTPSGPLHLAQVRANLPCLQHRRLGATR